jgi:UDP-N-acetylmuramoyl-L-alanyl-D-glutamate--2,6-diaminopimelate ligase
MKTSSWTPLTLETLATHLRARGLVVTGEGSLQGTIQGVSDDSRTLQPGDLFLAWKGGANDGHDHLAQAAARGAIGAVVERFDSSVSLSQLQIDGDGRRNAAIAAMAALGSPEEGIHVTAVTGTNGKTTTAFLIRHLLGGLGSAAALGTLGVVGPRGRVREGTGGLTTPGPAALARTLRELRDEGITHLVLEASSHALDQFRLEGLKVAVACFTNLTQDHLDYHGTLERYREAKAGLLRLLAPDGEVVVHAGDPVWAGLPPVAHRLRLVMQGSAPMPGIPPIRGDRAPATLRALALRLSVHGADFELESDSGEGGNRTERASVRLPLLGDFNVENALVAAGAAQAAGLSLEAIASRLATATPPPGRLELALTQPVPVILDYAHTPDALARVLETLRPLFQGRLIVVFGAGGDRDRTKRPKMGRVAVEGSDHAIVTSDNPRTEDPEQIVDDLVAGFPPSLPSHRWTRIVDRREAMAHALRIATPGDVVLLAGKGHETTQTVGREVRPFDERVILAELLAEGQGRA